MLDHPQNCFCNGDHTCNVGKGCTKATPQGTTTFPLKSSPKKTMELKVKNKGKCASIFYQVVVILSIHLISGCRTTASIPAFQAGDGGSTPLSRSNGMNLANSAQQRHRILAKVIPGFCQGLMTVTAQAVQWIMPLLCQYNRNVQLPPGTRIPLQHAPHSGHIRVFKFVTQTTRHAHCIIHTKSRAVWSRFIPHHCPGSIAGRSPAESRNQGKTESSCFG